MSERSRITVDAHTFKLLFNNQVAILIDQGYTVTGAYAIAREEIGECFLCDPFTQVIEDQKDAEDDKLGITD